ncbi:MULTISPECIES: hypothetical protein [Staphylococcus]|uniref:Uncharacterized protein n=2 Tax=Staphylococcus cohnii TaxID=29382 RepID=A0ABT6J2F2_9STAP|nr:hypothetical protein [Staphylococcus cohnii]TGP64810.1 hypothetical protein EN872_02830 [bacterium M00.F.Ca.ET.229.01.1.1]TGS41305.1 hypothetical protein EN823_02830 [bacterium M00.F.Ca.ET.180.01.1.1]AYX88797.1 hypothetical protein EGX68_00465 [Staphylococcus cohnii]KKI63860.1 hypothetical protein UF66_0349 [Staphylococcus cohnii subsp. cohnii]MCI2940562.1 hypothetical protein [Staphylococcus cohnii]
MNHENDKKKYQKIEVIANTFGIVALILVFASLILALIFEWKFLDYVVNGSGVLIILSLIISAIPHVMEKNIKIIVFDIIFIVIIAIIFYSL